MEIENAIFRILVSPGAAVVSLALGSVFIFVAVGAYLRSQRDPGEHFDTFFGSPLRRVQIAAAIGATVCAFYAESALSRMLEAKEVSAAIARGDAAFVERGASVYVVPKGTDAQSIAEAESGPSVQIGLSSVGPVVLFPLTSGAHSPSVLFTCDRDQRVAIEALIASRTAAAAAGGEESAVGSSREK